MRTYGFHAPQEKIAPRFWHSEQDYTHVNTGRFVRNAVLDGLTYNSSDLAPAWLKTRDAIHPLFGYKDQLGGASSVFGGCSASAAPDNARGILCPQNTATWWAPGGNGVNAWLYAKLPEATLVETYDVGSNAASCPLSWKLQGSLDGTTWTDIHDVSSTGTWDATYECKTFTVPEETRGTYLYYKLLITASNATTMQLRSLRLYRAASTCAKGQILLDASAASPLLLSFADGLSGTTPVDHSASISAAQLTNMFDDNGYPTCHNTPITSNLPVNIYAVRGAGGDVTVEYEDASGELFVQADGGMASAEDKGWVCDTNNADIFTRFGTKKSSGNLHFICSNAKFTYSGVGGVFVDKVVLSFTGALGSDNLRFSIIELDGTTETPVYGGGYYDSNYNVKRRISGIHLNGVHTYNGTGVYGIRLYSPSAPEYRFSSGKLYTREAPSDDWTQCQKIKLGTAVLTPDGEVFQPLCLSSLEMQWMSNGSAETYLGA